MKTTKIIIPASGRVKRNTMHFDVQRKYRMIIQPSKKVYNRKKINKKLDYQY